MNFPPYPFATIRESEQTTVYSFKSVSAEKQIVKLVFFSKLDEEIYNLALVDVTEAGELSDTIVSDNQDMEIILATVIKIMIGFLRIHPEATLSLEGSTPSRTRLYRIVIATYFTELSLQFSIYGLINGVRETFKPSRPYESFFVQKIKRP